MTDDFRAEAERRALEERRLLGLSDRCRLDPVLLAHQMGIEVHSLSKLDELPPEDLHHLQHDGVKAFSAAAVIDLQTNAALIVVNDKHSRRRQANSIAHELAHLILEHPPRHVTLKDPNGPVIGLFSALTQAEEEEADWLAGCLLVPAAGIRATMRTCADSVHHAAAHYGVSVRLMRWRLSAVQA